MEGPARRAGLHAAPAPAGRVSRWWPVRKVAAAALAALFVSPALAAWLAGSDLDWRALVVAVVVAVVPVVVAYLTPAQGGAQEGD